MEPEETVEQILGTYDISPRLFNRIRTVAVNRAHEMHLNSFDSVYEMVSHLVDVFSVPFREMYALKLDARIGNSESTFYEIIGREDSDIAMLFEDEESVDSYRDTMAFIDRLHPKYADFLRQLMVDSDSPVISPDIDIELVHRRLDELASKYGVNGRLVIPRAGIAHVELDPMRIRFRRRNIVDPVQYFTENRDLYNGLKRSQLKRVDKPLYRRLTASDQIAIVIPERHTAPTMTQDEIKSVLDKLKENNGNVLVTAQQTGHQPKTIRTHARKSGMATRPRTYNPTLPQEKIDQIVAAYETFDGKAMQAAKYLGVSSTAVTKYWRSAGLAIRRHSLSQEEIDVVVDSYKTYNGSSKQAAKNLPYSANTFLKHWKNARLQTRTSSDNYHFQPMALAS